MSFLVYTILTEEKIAGFFLLWSGSRLAISKVCLSSRDGLVCNEILSVLSCL